MPLPVLDTAAASLYASLYTFHWGDASVARYCRWSNDLVVGNAIFSGDMSIAWAFDGAPNTGIEDVPLTITMRMTLPPCDTLNLPYPHAPVNVLVQEMAPGIPESVTNLFSGQVAEVKTKPNGQDFLTDLTVSGKKARLVGELGIIASSNCDLQFGDDASDPRCGVELAPITKTGTVTNVKGAGDATRIVIDFDGTVDLSDDRWARGYVQVDGCRITIKKSLGDGSFFLREIIPPWWINKPVIAVPGCTKTLENCRYWDNELRFLALGRFMPLRNPVYEKPQA